MKKALMFIVFTVTFLVANVSFAKNLSNDDVKNIVVRMIDIQKIMGSSDAKISITDVGPVMRFGVWKDGHFKEYAILGYDMCGLVIIVYQIVEGDELLPLYSEFFEMSNGKLIWKKEEAN